MIEAFRNALSRWRAQKSLEARERALASIIPPSHRAVATDICVAHDASLCEIQVGDGSFLTVRWAGGDDTVRVSLTRDRRVVCLTDFRHPYGGITVHSTVPVDRDRREALTEMRDKMVLARDIARGSYIGKMPASASVRPQFGRGGDHECAG